MGVGQMIQHKRFDLLTGAGESVADPSLWAAGFNALVSFTLLNRLRHMCYWLVLLRRRVTRTTPGLWPFLEEAAARHP